MATVRELSAPYANFMVGPRRGPGVCRRCFNLIDGYDYCYACTCQASVLDVIAPISYSIAHEQLHHALASYKRLSGTAGRRLSVQLAAVLWRFLAEHESCVAQALGTQTFPIVTTVPSGDEERDESHPLRWIVSEAVAPTRTRHRRLLRRSSLDVPPRSFSPTKFRTTESLSGDPVLLIDDTWTTGANAQSAAAALKAAGAGPVAAVVIGRHVNRDWRENDLRLRRLNGFDWTACALCAPAPATSETPPRVPA
jgi:predicted amidophosphoribosyltransferase